MGKLKSFRIILSSEEPAYYPGDVVEGQCEIQIAEGEFSIKSLAITLRGYTKVHWTESRNVGARLGPYTQHFMAGSEYMKEKKILAHPTMGKFGFPDSMLLLAFVSKYIFHMNIS